MGWPIPLQQTGDCSADGQQNQKHIRSCREKGCSTGDNKTGGGSVRVPEVDMVYSLSGMDEIYASLRKGYVDAITGHESALERFVGNAPDMYAILDESLYISELGVAFKNDTHQDLAKKMTQILKEMQDDGTLRDMVEKYGLDAEKALGVTNAE